MLTAFPRQQWFGKIPRCYIIRRVPVLFTLTGARIFTIIALHFCCQNVAFDIYRSVWSINYRWNQAVTMHLILSSWNLASRFCSVGTLCLVTCLGFQHSLVHLVTVNPELKAKETSLCFQFRILWTSEFSFSPQKNKLRRHSPFVKNWKRQLNVDNSCSVAALFISCSWTAWRLLSTGTHFLSVDGKNWYWLCDQEVERLTLLTDQSGVIICEQTDELRHPRTALKLGVRLMSQL
jgi:hypothetical protein